MIKELEALENIKSLFVGSSIDLSQQFDIIEKALKDYEQIEYHNLKVRDFDKKLKALEIIKKKNVSICWLKSCKDRAEYNDLASKEEQLTQEEYDLLKEALK